MKRQPTEDVWNRAIEGYAERLKALHGEDVDIEMNHINADRIVEEALRAFGLSEIADAYEPIGKWYG